MSIIGRYNNGNINTILFNDGTKIRISKDDVFKVERPENIDIKITNYCDAGCAYCHENSTTYGKHADIMNAVMFDTIKPYTELAIGGGNPLSHPDLIPFLEKLKEKKIIANITVNQKHFMNNVSLLRKLTEEHLIWGLGISLINPTRSFIETVKTYFPNAVIHMIYKIISWKDIKELADHGLKILILGYKNIRRGADYALNLNPANEINVYNNLHLLKDMFSIVSFDNLALSQLNVKRLFNSEEEWNTYYMGDDGEFSFYIDLVKEEYSKNSTSPIRYSFNSKTEDISYLWKELNNKGEE